MRKFILLLCSLGMNVSIHAQCTPAIPSGASVVSSTTTNNGGFTPLWVCSGDTLISNGGIRDVFLEPGAVMLTGGGIDNIYVKTGAKLIMTGGIHDIYYQTFSNLTLSGGIPTTISCPSLSFNYSNAPANGCAPALPLSVTVYASRPTCHGGCDGLVTATASGGFPPYSYKWVGGPSTATDSNLCPGTYTVVTTDVLNNIDSQSVVVADTPLIEGYHMVSVCTYYRFGNTVLTSSGNYTDTNLNAFGCDSISHLILTVSPINTGVTKSGSKITATANGVWYQWLDCDNGMAKIPGATSKSYTGVAYKFYAVEVTSPDCTDTSECVGINPTGIANLAESTFQLFPNPVENVLNITSNQDGEMVTYLIRDMYGKELQRGKLNGKSSIVDVSELPAGYYALLFQENEGYLRFVKK